MKKILILLLVLAVAAPGCSWFKPKKEKPAEVLAADGVRYYDKGDYTRAIESFEKLKDWYPFSKYAILAELKLADSYFHRGNYEDAIYAYEYFEGLHPRNDAIPYVIFQMGMCNFKQMALPDRDQTFTEAALRHFHRLTREYPDSPEAAKAVEHIKICQENLARHELFVGSFYFKSKEFEAALARFNLILTTYPDVGVHKTALTYVALCNAYIAKAQARAEVKREEEEKERKAKAEQAYKALEKQRAKAGEPAAEKPAEAPESDSGQAREPVGENPPEPAP